MKKGNLLLSIIFYLVASFLLSYYYFLELTSDFFMSEIGRVVILCFICLFLYLGGIVLSKYLKNNKAMKINIWIFLMLYLSLFITLTLIDPMWGRNGFKTIKWSRELFNNYINNSLNIIPFKTITLYIKCMIYKCVNKKILIYNLYGNFLCLMPFALIIFLLFNSKNKTLNFFIICLLFTLIIELLQFITLSGSCDIDDIILNVTGAMVIFRILNIKFIGNLIRKIFLLEKKNKKAF